ncbi:MAG: type II secretion system F family protein [Candidatus Omnitrophica bacterium]|nr:type II secretion system F family protein [Candidatus Omnitrophota bacterium]
MPKFRYRARDRFGSFLTGAVEADGRMILAQNLRKLGYNVISIRELNVFEQSIERMTQRLRGIPKQEVLVITRQLGTMLSAGIPMLPCLESIANQTPIEKLKFIIRQIINDVRQGLSLSQALGKHAEVFSDLFVNVVHVGEATGQVDQTLSRLAEAGTKEQQLRGKVRAALTYPCVLVVAGILVVVFLLVKIIPQFSQIFLSADVPLPLPTKILLSISGFLQSFWWLLLILVIAFIGALQRFAKTENGRYHIDHFILRLPIIGELILKSTIAQMSRSLALLTKSGVTLLNALEVVEKTIGNRVMMRIIQNVRSQVTEGKKLTEPLAMSGFFPPMVIQMLAAGEETGNLDRMFEEVANFYDVEVSTMVDNLTSLLEPFLLLVMGGIVAFIALSVLLPIFNLVKVFRK